MTTVTIRLDEVRRAMVRWLDDDGGDALDGLTAEERSVALVALGYDTPSHAALVGIPPEHLAPAREIAGRL